MSVFRRYNEQTKRWEPVASSDATSVFSGNPILTEEGKTSNVEEILIKDRQDIELLKKNVSWLAKHGGGGGFGTGSGAAATVQILSPTDYTTPITNLVWKPNISSIPVKVVSTYSGTYTLDVRINGKSVYTQLDVKRNVIVPVPTNNFGIKNDSVTLQIVAIDESEMEYTETCKINIAQVDLKTSGKNSVEVTQSQLLNSQPFITLSYRTSIPGDYKLYYSDTDITYDYELGWKDSLGSLDSDTRSQYIDILNTGTGWMNPNIILTDVHGNGSNVGLIDKNVAPGIYPRYFVLVAASDPTICSDVIGVTINVLVTNGILISPQFGIDKDKPYPVSLDSVLNLNFIAYSKNVGLYSYTVWCDGVKISDGKSNMSYGAIISDSILLQNVFDKPGKKTLTIKALGQGIEAEANVYIEITQAVAEYVNAYKQAINGNTIFDYTFWENASDTSTSATYVNKYFTVGSNKKEISQNLNIYNRGGDSLSTRVYYKFRHTCFGKIDSNGLKWFPKNDQDGESLIQGQSYQFTLSMAYRIDEEVDDNATIFYLGNYNPSALGGDGTGAGILVTAHGYYIRIDGTTIEGILTDNDFTQLDMVMKLVTGDVTTTRLYIYQNGALLQAVDVLINKNSDYSLYEFKEALIGCRSTINRGDYYSVTHPINMDLYSVKLFNTPLNDGQIICNYINNYANYKRLSTNNALDSVLIERMLRNNGIQHDDKLGFETDINNEIAKDDFGNNKYDQSQISTLYNIQDGTYNWGVGVSGSGDITLGNNLQNLPIPIVTISGLNWTYSQFRSTSTKLEKTTGKFRYIDGTNTIEENGVEIEPQGTTTLNYNIKNINLIFIDKLFSPKSSWFPEKTFTLKADVVDSGHLNNAVIGTFVNNCFNNSELIETDAFPAYNKINSNKQSNGGKLPNDLTFKATIEGFPILLVMDFVAEGNTGGRNPQVMGIYSFNLGRESYYNQGLEVLTCLRDVKGNILDPKTISFPSLFGSPQGSDIDSEYRAYCFEGDRSFDSTIKDDVDINSNIYDFASVNMQNGTWMWLPNVQKFGQYVQYNGVNVVDYNNEAILWSSNNVKKYRVLPDGYFWSDDPSYSSSLLWSMRYHGGNSNEAQKAWDVLCQSVARNLQYNKGSVTRAYDTTYPQYAIKSAQGEALERTETGNLITIYAPQQKESLPFSVKNSAFYFVVCMLFGLVDNFGKNLQFKGWASSKSSPKWSPTFYDMDTALGLDNTGSQTVLPTVFDESIINTPANKVDMLYENAPNASNGVITVCGNKLWGGLENYMLQNKYTTGYGSEEEYRVYSLMWSSIRTTELTNIDDFIEKYMHTQLNNCGEFMYNYDYDVKYLSTSQIHMLHGNRLSFIRSWLTERIAFLDSVFGYKFGNNNEERYLNKASINPYSVSWKNQVNFTHNSGSLYAPITTNKSVIIRTNIGNKSFSYVYAKKNERTNIPMADSLRTPDIQTLVNNSDCIIDMNLSSMDITKVVAQTGNIVSTTAGAAFYPGAENSPSLYYHMGSLSSIKKLNLKNANLVADLNLFNLCKTWDTSPLGFAPNEFALQELDLSGVKSSAVTANLQGLNLSSDSGLNSVYKSPFTNITSVDVSNSNISAVNIPEGVSLYNLNIENSNIQSIKLREQPLLGSISFNGCKNLGEIEIISCDRFTNLTFDSTLLSIKKITIASCNSLETIEINGTNYKYLPILNITDCPNLKNIIIDNCKGQDVSDGGVAKTIYISATDNLEELIINNSYYEIVDWDGVYELDNELKGLTKLEKLDFKNSNIKSIYNHNTKVYSNESVIDLHGFSSDHLTTISMQNNKVVEYIHFDNIEDKPFLITTNSAFSGCSMLTRVYGNINISAQNVFNNTNFTIHNGKFLINGEEIDVLQNKVYLHPKDLNILTESGVMFQKGSNVTNMRLVGRVGKVGSNPISCFKSSKCDTFDAYYILQNIDEKVTNINDLFKGSSVEFSWGEDFDNSPNRYTFSRCGNIESIDNIFENAIKEGCRLFSPLDGEPGIFTPLTSMESMSRCFGTMPGVICDNQLFASLDGSTEWFKSLTNIDHFSPYIVVNDVNIFSYNDIKTIKNGNLYDYTETIGNLDGFFKQCTSLGNSSKGELNEVMSNLLYINYDKFDEGLGLPNYIKTLNNTLVSSFASGTLNLKKLFGESGSPSLTNIYSSIRVNNDFTYKHEDEEQKIDIMYCVWNLDQDIFNGFENLENIGYTKTENKGGSIESTSFGGRGLHKFIKDSFPYDIIKNLAKLKSFVGFFKDCDLNFGNLSEAVELPGGLFSNNHMIEDISYCFYGINRNGKVELSSMAFKDCPNLKDVSYLFGCNVNSDGGKSGIKNLNIPAKLFYHGETEVTKTIQGTNYEYEESIDSIRTSTVGDVAIKNISETNDGSSTIKVVYEYLGYTKIDDNTIMVTPVTTINKVTTKTSGLTTETKTEAMAMNDLDKNIQIYTYSYPQVTRNISNMKGCFQGADIRPYKIKNFSDDYVYPINPESCPDFQPFKYSYINGMWKAAKQNLNRYTYMWLYDGNRMDYYNHINNSNIKSNLNALMENDLGLELKLYLPDDAYLSGVNYSNDSGDSSSDVSIMCHKGDLEHNKSTMIGHDMDLVPNLCGSENIRNFCTAPDIFRYSASNADITDMFMNCGMNSHSFSEPDRKNVFMNGNGPDENLYGLKGRLCPYLLQPLTDISSIANLFKSCTWLGGYAKKIKNDNGEWGGEWDVYMIPESFFSYLNSNALNMNGAFYGWIWPLGSKLNVFNFNSSDITLNLEETFMRSIFTYNEFHGLRLESDSKNWEGRNTEIQNVFSSPNIYVNSLYGCFAINTITKGDGAAPGTLIIDQPVMFYSNIFNRHNTVGKRADMHVFSGYRYLGKDEDDVNYADPDKNFRFYTPDGFWAISTSSTKYNYVAQK